MAIHLAWHQARVDRAVRDLGLGWRPDLEALVSCLDLGTAQGRHRLRIDYGMYPPARHTLEPYLMPRFDGWLARPCPAVDYRFKGADRSGLGPMSTGNRGFLWFQEGFLVEAPFANILVERQGALLTPRRCLHQGTARQRLLSEGRIREADLPIGELNPTDRIHYINAMLDPGDLCLPWAGTPLDF